MSRSLVVLVVIVVVLVGGMALLGSRVRERPQARVEKAVSLANLS
jgi:hypothetical protein